MKPALTIDALIKKLSLEIIAQVDQSALTLGYIEQKLTAFAEDIRRETNALREMRLF